MKKIAAIVAAVFAITAGTAVAGTTCHTTAPAPVRGEDGIFLCYSPTQVTPVVFAKSQAALLVANDGYVEAQGVAGNVEGDTNVGAYHLVCNATGSDTHTAVDTAGEVFGVDYGPQYEELGFYQIFA